MKDVIKNWPKNVPLLVFGGGERFHFVPICFSRATYADCAAQQFIASGDTTIETSLQSGWVGLLNYSNLHDSKIWRVYQTLVFDRQTGEWSVEGEEQAAEFVVRDPSLRSGRVASSDGRLTLEPCASDEDYLAKAKHVIDDIARGQYYQLNLLRYFSIRGDNVDDALLDKFCASTEAMSAYFTWDEQAVISFSPERFVRIRPEGENLKLEAFPVKGTRPRHEDLFCDELLAEQLKGSTKDRAELAMIIDLMRNDFYAISQKNSIKVESAAHLKSHTQVHHLEGHISSNLKSGVTFGELAEAIFPAGSITGAPKIEVMKHIRELEARDRGFFMGSAFYWDERGYLDSSVLIRTAVKEEDWTYAAGSGLVCKSRPAEELTEIETKCRILTASSTNNPD